MSVFTRTGTENQMRWDRSSPRFMEVWYATMTHRESGSGLWFRYTITAPDKRFGSPYCELWAFYFDPDIARSFAGKQRLSIDQLSPPSGRDDGALVRIGDAWLSENHLEGSLESRGRTISWSLDFEPDGECFQHLPQRLLPRLEKRVSVLCSPNLSVPFSGTVKVDGDAFELEREPGQQSHRWGRAHSSTWTWAHCSLWDDDDRAVFEGVAAKAALGPLPAPTMTFAYLQLEDEQIPFNELRWAFKAKSSYEMPTWAFTARTDRWRVVGASRAHPDRFVQVTYADPDSTLRYCANSEIADLALEIYRRESSGWRHHKSLTATRTAHLEFGQKDPFPELPIHL